MAATGLTSRTKVVRLFSQVCAQLLASLDTHVHLSSVRLVLVALHDPGYLLWLGTRLPTHDTSALLDPTPQQKRRNVNLNRNPHPVLHLSLQRHMARNRNMDVHINIDSRRPRTAPRRHVQSPVVSACSWRKGSDMKLYRFLQCHPAQHVHDCCG